MGVVYCIDLHARLYDRVKCIPSFVSALLENEGREGKEGSIFPVHTNIIGSISTQIFRIEILIANALQMLKANGVYVLFSETSQFLQF